jgi:hypothetical protein
VKNTQPRPDGPLGEETPEVQNHEHLPIGARVRLYGHQWPEALRSGTGTIVDVVMQHSVDGSWEYLVETADGKLESWNHVVPVEHADQEIASGGGQR